MLPNGSSHPRSKLIAYSLLGIICGALFVNAASEMGITWSVQPHAASGVFGELQQFRSENQLKEFLKTSTSSGYYGEYWGWTGFLPFLKAVPTAQYSLDTTSGGVKYDYSQTNIQVEGVDEADIIKTDGKYIYYAHNQAVYIALAYPPADAKLLSKISVEQGAGEIYIYGDKLVLFTYEYGPVMGIAKMPPGGIMPYISTQKTVVKIYDVSNRVEPKLVKDFKVDAGYLSSRMIGGVLYIVAQRGAWIRGDVLELPVVEEGKTWSRVQPTDIYYTNSTEPRYNYTMIISVNVDAPEEPAATETFLLGYGSVVYVSQDSLYLVVSNGKEAIIHKIGLLGGLIKYIAEGRVPGWVLNQFSMDESNGYFRIATTTSNAMRGGSSSSSAVYILNKEMKTVGKVEDLAPGEQIYSARFMGNRCYLVTFKKVDPLFVIDLSEPTTPRVLGKLKIPGYSNYLHPYDENHVIGLGKETVEAEQGDFAWYQGIKISLFDVTDVTNPIEEAKIEVGDRGTDSPALNNHKAFLFSKEKNLLIIPITEAKINSAQFSGTPPANAYGDFVYQGAYIFNISSEGFTLRGRITHIKGDELLKSGYWFDSEYSIERSLYIGNILYTISGQMIKANNLTDLKEISSIELK